MNHYSLRHCLLPAALVLPFVPSLALAQAASVDQVLGAVAEVIRDRAKQVAAQAIANKLRKRLCNGTIEVPREGMGKLILYLGGKKLSDEDRCRKRYDEGACGPDELFIRTCRAAIRMETPLTDPYFLKSLSRDTVDFLMRVSARRLAAGEYVDSGLVEVGAFVHAALERLSGQPQDASALSDPLLALADRLHGERFYMHTFEELAADGAPRKLEAILWESVVKEWVSKGCPPFSRDGKGCEAAWYANTCEAYDDPKAPRKAVFDQLFGEAGPLAAGRNDRCQAAFPADPMKRAQCWRARLTHNLYGQLVRGRCAAERSDASRTAFRELTYVVDEEEVYREALQGLLGPAGGGGAVHEIDELDAFIVAVERVRLTDLPRAELAAAVRFLGSYVAALGEEPERTKEWLQTLLRELDDALKDPIAGYDRLLRRDALGSASPFREPVLGALRGATKDLLTLPAFSLIRVRREVERTVPDVKGLMSAAEGVRLASFDLIRAVSTLRTGRASTSELLEMVTTFIKSLASLAEARAPVVEELKKVAVRRAVAPAAKGASVPAPGSEEWAAARNTTLANAARALQEGASVVKLASKRDWVGIAMRINDSLEDLGARGNVEELERSMRFVRVLLSMYQAESVEEAKAIFAANLEDAASRERRFENFTVDVAALVGARVGTERAGTGLAYGISAPVGFQLATGTFGPPCLRANVGFLFYPLDLGGYVSGTVDGSDSRTVKWQDALRPGLAAYWRIWSDVPVLLGVGADVKPRFDQAVLWRWYGTVGLELPLYTIH